MNFWKSNGNLPCFVAMVFGAFLTAASAQSMPEGYTLSHPQAGATVISDDLGKWGGASLGASHQRDDQYWTQKTLFVPRGALEGVAEARLQVYLALQDNSMNLSEVETNGLDESFELLVNDQPHLYRTDEPFLRGRARREELMKWHWAEFTIPVGELLEGENHFIFRKTPGEKHDDYLYIGIDNTVSFGHSQMSLNAGETWKSDSLNTIQATGEYMVRLLLLEESPQRTATWTPQGSKDEEGLIGYSEREQDGPFSLFHFELDHLQIDPSQSFAVTVETKGVVPEIHWLDEQGEALAMETSAAEGVVKAEASIADRLAKVSIRCEAEREEEIAEVRFDYVLLIGSGERRVKMAPIIHAPQGEAVERSPKMVLADGGFTVENATQIARYETSPRLRLVSLQNEYLQKNVLAQPEATHLFLVELEGKRYGAEDWEVAGVEPLSPTQVRVRLTLPERSLAAQFTVSVDAEKMTWGLEFRNESQETLSWKTLFPHLGGLQLSSRAEEDYYLFPIKGGAIASQAVHLRTYYGDESAWWQMIDLFSPEGGAGLMLRCLDTSGLFKGMAMRKGELPVTGGTFFREVTTAYMDPEMGWEDSLAARPGTSLGFEYLKYTRAAGDRLALPEAAIEMHAGDWHEAMQRYADWAHEVWTWRPFPSPLQDIWNILPVGWGRAPLYRDGQYRTDFISDKADVAELMSWWQWSKNGPWRIPMDRLEEELEPAFYKAYQNYWVINPATGEREYPLNRGDYEYNTGWGGLPALKENLEAIRAGGQMPMFYTDPILADDNTKLGHEHGPKYGVVNPRWKPNEKSSPSKTPPGYVGSYGSWNMDIDTRWYQDFLVEQTVRIVKDTGVDGIRFDEFGHRGYTCHNPEHEHLFAEPGHNAWLQAVTQACRRVHEAVDQVKPDFVLTAEYPGYDHLSATLEGAINYESSGNVFPGFRPVPLNVFRFYFPESKPFDLNNRKAPHGAEWIFWNASGAFSTFHPPRYHRILKQNGDAFGSREVRPLVPTLVENIYANRFEGGGKTITLLYNATGFTAEKAMIAAPERKGYHYFDLLHGRELIPQNEAIVMKLGPDEVAAVALLPEALRVSEAEEGWQVELKARVAEGRVSICRADGSELSTESISDVRVPLKRPDEGEAVYLKLFSGKYLVDAVPLP